MPPRIEILSTEHNGPISCIKLDNASAAQIEPFAGEYIIEGEQMSVRDWKNRPRLNHDIELIRSEILRLPASALEEKHVQQRVRQSRDWSPKQNNVLYAMLVLKHSHDPSSASLYDRMFNDRVLVALDFYARFFTSWSE